MTDNINIELMESRIYEKDENNSTNKTNMVRSDGVTGYDLVDKLKEYHAKTPINIAILTPTYGSLCYVNYVTSLLQTITLFSGIGIKIKVEFCRNDSLVSRARNNLIAKAMNDKSITHMLFIDADITWGPLDVVKLIVANKPIVGGIYPLKNYEWSRLENPDAIKEWIKAKNDSQLNNVISNEDMIQHKMLRYNLNYLGNVLEITHNLARVKHLATGFMMIRRDTIEKMSRAFPSTKYVDDVGFLTGAENDYAYALFDCGVEDNRYYSEDWLFCKRWLKMGGEVWIDVTINLNHTGIADFKGSFIASLL